MSKLKKVILLNGLTRSGKDTCADYLVKEHGYTKFAFADTIKEILSTTLGISIEEFNELKNSNSMLYEGNDRLGVSFRKIIQRFGNEAMKPIFGQDVWAKTLYEKIEFCENDKIVVSDFRFLIEYRPHDDLDIETWLIDDGRELPKEGHASDVELYQNDFKFDKVLRNSERNLLSYIINIEKLLDNGEDYL